MIGVLLRRVVRIFFLTDERILRDTRPKAPFLMMKDRCAYAQCAEIYSSDDAHMRHDILLSKHKQRVPRGYRHKLLAVA